MNQLHALLNLNRSVLLIVVVLVVLIITKGPPL